MNEPHQWQVYHWLETVDNEVDGKYLSLHSLIYEWNNGWLEYYNGILPLSTYDPFDPPRIPPEQYFSQEAQPV